jgi:cytochrome d ubiquinol oxidase subunit I
LAGIAGYYVRKGLHGETARTMLKIGIILFALTPLLQLATGHIHAIEVINMQPEKAAAFEGHFYTAKGAPLYAVGFVDEQNEKTYGIYAPKGSELFIQL